MLCYNEDDSDDNGNSYNEEDDNNDDVDIYISKQSINELFNQPINQ